MAKALNALGIDKFKAVDGEHAWRIELLTTLAGSQKKDGSWVNADSRWLEGDPNLVTGYALLTLGMLKP